MMNESVVGLYRRAVSAVCVVCGVGESIAEFPHHPLLDMVVGNLGKVKITAEDLLELKKLLNT